MTDRNAAIARQIIEKLPPQVQSAHVIVSSGENTPVNFENDKLKSIKTSRTTGLILKVIVDGRKGTASVSSVEDIDALIANAIATAKFGRQVKYIFPEPKPASHVRVFDPDVTEITTRQMVETCEEMIDDLKSYNPDVNTYAGASKSVSEFHMANTSGLRHSGRTTSYGLGVYGELVRGEDILYAGHGFGWRKAEIDHKEIARKAIERFRLAERNARIESGRYPVIFPPTGLSVILLTLQLALSGKNALLGDSPLSDKVGEKVASGGFSLEDSGLVDYMSGSSPYDSDGVAKRRTILIESGVLRGFLYDLDTASRSGVEPTGNDGCAPNNWIIGAGDTEYREMISSVKEGIIVEELMGLGQGNPISGEFSANVSLGYKIENGEIVGRIKNTMLAGNIYEALRQEIVVGSEREWTEFTGGDLYAPAILVPELNVVSK